MTEEDTYCSYSRLMLKYYVAEGVMSKHSVLVASADPSPTQLVKVSRFLRLWGCIQGVNFVVGVGCAPMYPPRKETVNMRAVRLLLE